jgi:predicted RecB family endonuclease
MSMIIDGKAKSDLPSALGRKWGGKSLWGGFGYGYVTAGFESAIGSLMIVELSLVLGAILFAIAIHYVMQLRAPDVRSTVIPYIDILRKKMEYVNEKIEKLDKLEQDRLSHRKTLGGRSRVDSLEERIEKLEKTQKGVVAPQFAALYGEMKDRQSEMKTAFERLQEIIGIEDIPATKDEVSE